MVRFALSFLVALAWIVLFVSISYSIVFFVGALAVRSTVGPSSIDVLPVIVGVVVPLLGGLLIWAFTIAFVHMIEVLRDIRDKL